jgi:hypothetical protein
MFCVHDEPHDVVSAAEQQDAKHHGVAHLSVVGCRMLLPARQQWQQHILIGRIRSLIILRGRPHGEFV